MIVIVQIGKEKDPMLSSAMYKIMREREREREIQETGRER